MRLRGPHGITGEAFRGKLRAASAFDGIIQAEENAPAGDEHGAYEPEQQATGVQRRPDGAMQDTMIRLKVGRCAASHDPENRRHRPLTRSKDGAGHEDFHMLPHGSRKDWGKDPQWHCSRRSARRAWLSLQDEENMSFTADRF